MTDERTDTQRAADDHLEDAIRAVLAAYSIGPPSAVLTTFVVLGETIGADADGEVGTYFKLYPGGGSDLNWTAAFGLVARADAELRSEYLSRGTS